MDVTLVLKANNSDQIAKMKESQKETQKVYDIAEKGGKREKGILEEIDSTLSRLEKSKRKAFTYEEIEKYNKKIQETKQNLQEYENAGVKANTNMKSSGDSLMQSVGKWALGFASVGTAVKLLKDAFQATEAGLRTFNVIGAVTKQVLYDIVTGSNINLSSILLSISANKELERIRVNQRKEIVEISKAETVYNELYFAASDQTKSQAEQLVILNQAMIQHEFLMGLKIDQAKEELLGIQLALVARPKETALLDAEAAKIAEIERLKGEGAASTKRLEMRRTGILKQFRDDDLKNIKDADDKKLKLEEQYQVALNALIDKYNASNIDSRTGVDKLKAQRDFALNEISILRTHLLNFGPLTNDQEGMIETLVGNVQKAFIKGMEKEAKITPAQKDAISKALLKNLPTLQGLRKDQTQPAAKKELTSIWQIFGIDTETDEGKKTVEAFKKAYEEISKIISDTNAKRVEDTRRRRELLDTQVSEAEAALNTEVELYKAGYASNVAAKKKELVDLKIQRDLALKKEEEALKKQRQFDAIEQASSLLTASANIIKGYSSLPVIGQILAIAAIGAMFAAFAAARVQAGQAAKFAKGGWTGDGRYRDETGERVAGVVHENEFVIKRGQASRYRPLLDAINRDDRKMILHSFNKLSPELLGGTTNVIVENEGPNKRLDQLITENKKLNAKLSSESIQNFGNVQVIRKGNSIRTIR
jgi:hypothetical protein